MRPVSGQVSKLQGSGQLKQENPGQLGIGKSGRLDRLPTLTPMHLAAERGHIDAIKVLKEMGADISSDSYSHGTSMHLAAKSGHSNAIKVLWGLGADILT
jgi:Ankyrin repeats (3 copies)